MSEDAESTTAEFKKLIDQLVTWVNDMVNGFREFVGKWADSAWRYVLGPAVINFDRGMKALSEKLGKIVQDIQKILDHSTPIVSIIVQGFSWLENAQRPASQIQGVVKQHPDANIGHWEGAARNAYNEAVDAQHAALGAIKTKADNISGWLLDIAKANIMFVKELGDAFAAIAGEFVAILVEAGTIVGALEAIGKTGDLIEKLVTTAGERLTKVVEMYSEAVGRTRDATSIQYDAAEFPNDKWPSLAG
ncbi:hypothetical protein [Amycolatopsis silviterrae]|uniref:WXG100 family type VII secretion target n=1 Tax=Amycolatopsis silviterrae TaxID=1656914 RepID=A0ABW5GY47_9PSEU